MPELPSPTPSLVEEELGRLLESAALRRAPSHMRLLRYLVDRRLAGDEAALREASIAFEVFRRDPATYDPQTDPIVRVTVRRLRDRLDAHYAHYDSPPKVRILLPKGRYAPEFLPSGPDARRACEGVAVLGTLNLTTDSALDGFCSAFANRLADDLARAGLPRVIARTSVDRVQAADATPTRIADALAVQWIVESVLAREHDGEVRLSARLVQGMDAAVRWIESAVAPHAHRHRLGDHVANKVVLRMAAGRDTEAFAAQAGALGAKHRSALDAVRLMLLQRTRATTDDAVALAEATTRECPDSGAAWAGLAAALYSRLSFLDTDTAVLRQRITACVDRALALEPDDPVALRTKAIIVGKCDYDTASAEALFARALRSVPHYTSARLNYAEILWLQGRFAEALAALDLALVYDPLSSGVRMARAMCVGLAGRHAEAREEWRLCRAAGDTSAWSLTEAGVNELAAGDIDAAEALLDEALVRYPDLPSAWWYRAYAWCARGELERAREQARACLARFPSYSHVSRASLAARLRERDAVVEHLTLAHAQADMGFLYASIAPEFEWLEDDAAFTAVLNRAGVAKWRGQRRQ